MRQIIICIVLFTSVVLAKEFKNPVKINNTLTYTDGNEGVSGECLVSSDTSGTVIWDTCPGGGGTTFDDATFQIFDTGDSLGAVFDVSAVTTADKTITMPDANVDLADIGTNASNFSGHTDGAASKHDATEIDFEYSDGSKKNIQASSDDVELAVIDLDDAVGTLAGSPTNYTPGDATEVGSHLSAIDTALGSAVSTDFLDGVFRISDTGDSSRKLAFDVGNIATSSTRTWTVPNVSLNFDTTTPGTGNFSNNTLSNLSTTSINQSLLFDTDLAYSIGSLAVRVNEFYANSARLTTSILGLTASSTTRFTINTNGATSPGGSSFIGLTCNDSANQRCGIKTDNESSTTNSVKVVLEAGNVVDGNGGNVELRPGKASGTGKDGIISLLGAAVLDKKTADPCDATEYPEGSVFYNDTSDYLCFCDGAGADVQVHSPATACF